MLWRLIIAIWKAEPQRNRLAYGGVVLLREWVRHYDDGETMMGKYGKWMFAMAALRRWQLFCSA